MPPTGRSPQPPAAKEPGQTTLSAALGICPPQPPSDGPHVTKRDRGHGVRARRIRRSVRPGALSPLAVEVGRSGSLAREGR
jgi:hypothetical protein